MYSKLKRSITLKNEIKLSNNYMGHAQPLGGDFDSFITDDKGSDMIRTVFLQKYMFTL